MLKNLRGRAADFVFAAPLTAAFIVMFAFFTIQGEGFFNADNLVNVALQSATLCIVAIAVGVIMIAGYIDLSVGSIMGFSGVTAGYLMTQSHWSPLWASVVGIGLAMLSGLLSGILVAYLRFSALIVTLGMLTILRGATFVITPQTFYDFGAGFGELGAGSFLGVPIPVWIAAAVCAVAAVFLKYTAGGRHVYAIGVSQEAAYFSGINVRRIPLLLFIMTGAAAGLAGIITIARIDAAPSGSLGVGMELSALTAVLLGGVSFSGGRGSVFGILLGVLFLGVLQNGLAIMNVSFANQQIANGLALVIATALEVGGASLAARGGARRQSQKKPQPTLVGAAGGAKKVSG
jgi:ribose/xylose/arabinose/galactoside ABC-type transport system permease subunit